ncbi:MAG: hypothetical protein CMQ24_16370 [Gammaproteobacteria bacterium]|nr:hypothetical protein [Gammaproteobacteria bacterium]
MYKCELIYRLRKPSTMSRILLSGGQVYDPASKTFSRADVAISHGLVEAIGTDLEVSDEHIDAEGQYIAPGFIDMHCHVFNHPLFQTSRLEADRIGVRQGVACVVDTGSAGPTTIDAFETFVRDTQHTHAYALCNIGSPGLPGIDGGHASRPELVSLSGTVKAIERHPDWILGVKVLASSSHTGGLGIEAVRIGRKAAALTGKPLMVHIGNAPPVIEEILELLRPGDIVTHSYHGKVGGVLGYGGTVIPEFRDAVDRGVIVDIAHGRSSFSFDTCAAALDQGMPVHTISSDLHGGNLNRYVVSLARTMSKFRLLGLSLEDTVYAVTCKPAATLAIPNQGTLEVGQPANLTVFAETDRAVEVEDAEGVVRTTSAWIEPHLTIVNGQVHSVSETL